MKKTGFTLIELLVVIAIIGILSAVVLTSLNSSREKANDTSKVASVKQIALAYELSRDQATGAFESTTSSTTAATALDDYINPWPAGMNVEDNSASTSSFCVWAEMGASTGGDYFAASEEGSQYVGTLPTLASCI